MKGRMQSWWFMGAVIAGAVVLAVTVEYITRNVSDLPVYGPKTVIDGEEQDHVLPSFELIAQDGGGFSSEALAGKVCVVNFFFTSCPSICPRMMRHTQSVYELYRNDPQVVFVSFTVDPKRDDAERLARYADGLNAHVGQWKFLTGEKKTIYHIARHGVFLSTMEGNGGEHDFIHSENLVLLDGAGRIRGYYNGLDPKMPDQLTVDIAKLKKHKS